MINFKAIYKPDKYTKDGYIMFYSKEVDNHLWFVMKNDELFKYPFEIPFLNDDWLILRSTGLKDMYGKEIFEGDIVAYDTNVNDNYLISYDNGSFVYMGDSIKQLFDYDARQFFIIGNIYENYQLIENNKLKK